MRIIKDIYFIENKRDGINYVHTGQSEGKSYNSPLGNLSYRKRKGDSRRVNNQTIIITENS
ncbi:MAG: hypothetical protein LBV03_05905 [Fusobacteriales bacterium]|nr:hypothetical protein [Fusobacteriales bacterium]